LAVLALDNLSGDPDMGFSVDGLSDEILQLIRRATKLRVIARASSFQFRGADKATRKVAADLGVTHVLDGAVRGVDRVHVSVRLVEVATQMTTWSQDYDCPAPDIFALQDEIAAAVASALEVRFTQPPRGRIGPVARELFLRARVTSPVDPGRRQLADQAVAAAPEFAPALALAASIRFDLGRLANDDRKAARLLEEARARAERAWSLDRTLPEAAAAFELCEPICGRWTERLARLQSVVEAAPNSPCALELFGFLAHQVGRLLEAHRFFRQARELDPLSAGPANNYACSLVWLGRYDEGLAVLEDVCRRCPTHALPLFNLIAFSAVAERWDLVDWWTEIAEEVVKPVEQVREIVWWIELWRGSEVERRRRMLGLLRRDLERNRHVNLQMLAFAAHWGCPNDDLYELADRASFAHLFRPRGRGELGEPPRTSPLFAPWAESLRDDARFVGLCARLGLIDHWVKSDTWPDCVKQVRYDFRAEARKAAEAPAGITRGRTTAWGRIQNWGRDRRNSVRSLIRGQVAASSPPSRARRASGPSP
jgi:TolB-like protein